MVQVKDGNIKNRHCIIVDDLVHSGGTLLSCAAALKAGGAKAVSLYVTHAILEQDAWKKFEKAEPGIRHFWVTDTNPSMAKKLRGVKPFVVLSIAPLLATVCEEIEAQNSGGGTRRLSHL